MYIISNTSEDKVYQPGELDCLFDSKDIPSIYKTTDNKRFYNYDNAIVWQANIDYNDYLLYKHNREIDNTTIILDNKNELDILLSYLRYYLDFESVYADYSELEYPTVIEYDINHKKMKIG